MVNTKEYFLQMAWDGIDYLEIRKKVNLAGFSEEERRSIMLEVDEIRLLKEQRSVKLSKANERLLLGVFVLILGLIVTIGTYITADTIYVLEYGLILGGAWMTLKGINARKEVLADYEVERFKPKKKGLFDRF